MLFKGVWPAIHPTRWIVYSVSFSSIFGRIFVEFLGQILNQGFGDGKKTIPAEVEKTVENMQKRLKPLTPFFFFEGDLYYTPAVQ